MDMTQVQIHALIEGGWMHQTHQTHQMHQMHQSKQPDALDVSEAKWRCVADRMRDEQTKLLFPMTSLKLEMVVTAVTVIAMLENTSDFRHCSIFWSGVVVLSLVSYFNVQSPAIVAVA